MCSRTDLTLDRRTVLALLGTGTTIALAGCGGGDTETTSDDTPTATLTDDVGEEYVTATALNGQRRDPDSLSSKDDVSYQDEPDGGQQCSGCAFYVPDKNGDGIGACAIVDGNIEPSGYCVSYVPHAGDGDDDTAAQAVDVPGEAACAVCGMTAADFPAWNAQARHADDTREFFCSTGCATTYYAVPEAFAATDAEIARLWVTGRETGEFLDGADASYALETDSDRLADPMRLNPVPFANREDAVAYVEEVGYLTESDIVGVSAFDRETASRYRGRFLD